MSDKYTKSARGQECQVRIPGVCNRDPETVVLAHRNGAGIGRKHMSIHGAYCCSACHDAVDGRAKTNYPPAAIKSMHDEAVFRTQELMVRQGVLVL